MADFVRVTSWTAAVAGIVALLLSPFFAAAYLATEDGADEPPAFAWDDAFRNAMGDSFGYDDPDQAYQMYGMLSWTMPLAILAGAYALHAHQVQAGRKAEPIGFWGLVAGAALTLVGTVVVFYISLSDVTFFAFLVPGMLLMILGCLVFGIGTIRAKVAPAAIGWLLAVGGPLQIVLSSVLGHNPLAFMFVLIAVVWAGFWSLRVSVSPRAGP